VQTVARIPYFAYISILVSTADAAGASSWVLGTAAIAALTAWSRDHLLNAHVMSCLLAVQHLYESFGFWRAGAELRKIHFAEVSEQCCCWHAWSLAGHTSNRLVLTVCLVLCRSGMRCTICR
jgi:hypothetical protein